MVRNHRRFELLNVTLDESPIGSCTIDLWEDDDGREQWAARLLMKTGHGSTEGILAGSTRTGDRLQGKVRFAADQQGPRGGRTVLVELHGQGPLEPTTAAAPTPAELAAVPAAPASTTVAAPSAAPAAAASVPKTARATGPGRASA